MGIVLACVVLLVLLARLDRAAYEGEMARARKAIAASRLQAAPAGRRVAQPGAPPHQAAPRTQSLGDRGPIVLPVGGAWSGGTAATVPDVAHAVQRPGAPESTGALRRIVGPSAAGESAVPDAAVTRARPAPAPRPAAAARPGRSSLDVVVATPGGRP